MVNLETRSRIRKDGVHRLSFTGSSLTTTVLIVTLCAAFIALTKNMQKPGCYRRPYNTSQLGHEVLLADGSHQFRIMVVTDLDKSSKHPTEENQWQSFIEFGILTVNKDYTEASLKWNSNEQISLYSTIAGGGRSMELSDLVVFDGKLLSIDDRTGIIYRIEKDMAYPWIYLSDGAGNATKGFKGEWMTVKDGNLYVGGLGKEWTTTEGVFDNEDPMWIKLVTPEGSVEHISWVNEYKKLRSAVGIEWPGYMVHESVQWSEIYKKWFFLPRRASKQVYNEAEDEERGTNYLLSASEDFSDIKYQQIGPLSSTRGFSAFQFVPGTSDRIIVALKSEEKDTLPVASYITVFNHEMGHILLEEMPLFGKFKYEGIAFV
ncbi:MGC52693 protein, putative [Brugia malayi]|uniref:Bm3194 n=1 Tax=Brugia malayi TaxID=6279 RepID=A0A0K0J979_BRUMA|nr:MGC52693 protein, putative [Brugia malayi]CDP99451.1 Bm3194 [Brugia malayi]VIO99677.1 MGC52693 protein, putative [Brugia malayi]